MRHQPSSLGKKNSSVNQEDWEAILAFILLGTATDRTAVTEDVEAVAKVERGLTITLQKKVEGITVSTGCRVTNISY